MSQSKRQRYLTHRFDKEYTSRLTVIGKCAIVGRLEVSGIEVQCTAVTLYGGLKIWRRALSMAESQVVVEVCVVR